MPLRCFIAAVVFLASLPARAQFSPALFQDLHWRLLGPENSVMFRPTSGWRARSLVGSREYPSATA